MKKLFLTIATVFATSGFAASEFNIMSCKSIDTTFRPYYLVNVTRPVKFEGGKYRMVIEKTSDLAGTKKTKIEAIAEGKVTNAGFFFDFKQVAKQGHPPSKVKGSMKGKMLSNGVLRSEIQFDGSNRVSELSCRMLR